MTPPCGHMRFNVALLGIQKNSRRLPRARKFLGYCLNIRRRFVDLEKGDSWPLFAYFRSPRGASTSREK